MFTSNSRDCVPAMFDPFKLPCSSSALGKLLLKLCEIATSQLQTSIQLQSLHFACLIHRDVKVGGKIAARGEVVVDFQRDSVALDLLA